MAAAFVTYFKVDSLGRKTYAVGTAVACWDTLAVVDGTSRTLTGGVSCPFRKGGIARISVPGATSAWNFGSASSTPDAAAAGRQVIIVQSAETVEVPVKYGMYPAVKTA